MRGLLAYPLRGFRWLCPSGYYWVKYSAAARTVRGIFGGPAKTKNRRTLFREFIASCENKKCLQIGVKEEIGEKFGSNWVSVDKYDTREFIDFHYDIQKLEFEDGTFDALVCWSILEHVPQPHVAIAEMTRVLKPGGEIWIQMPFLFPYHEDPKDFWRVTPDGLRVWMKDFSEIACGCDFWAGTSLVAATFFHGKKQN